MAIERSIRDRLIMLKGLGLCKIMEIVLNDVGQVLGTP